jgi:hypothetical protein
MTVLLQWFVIASMVCVIEAVEMPTLGTHMAH